MRIGIVSKWIASGQAVVARQLRSALEQLGHQTFVLARPGSGPRAQGSAPAGDPDPVWDQPAVTEASDHRVPAAEYEAWVRANSIETVLCDENYQFEEIGGLREQGVIATATHVVTRDESRAALAHDDRAAGDPLATVPLDAQMLGI